jgi:hypothetical protein
MDSIDGTNGLDNMDTLEYRQPDPANGPGPANGPDPASTTAAGGAAGLGAPADWTNRPSRARWSGRTKRVVTSVGASAVLLGSGAAIGVALTGGASASTGSTSAGTVATTANTSATTTAAATLAGRCARLAHRVNSSGHPAAATRLAAFCRNPLLRLALVGGAHGEVTFQTATGPKTIAVERGTIQSVSSSGITVLAKDGTTWTWNFTTSTVVREARQVVARGKLSDGESVLVAGQVVNGAHDARLIRIHSAGPA